MHQIGKENEEKEKNTAKEKKLPSFHHCFIIAYQKTNSGGDR